MTLSASPLAVGRFTKDARVLAAIAALLGCGGFLGWVLDLPGLRSILPGLGSMKPNTAVGLFALGVALWSEARSPLASKVFTGFALALGGATLAEHLTIVELGIDDLLTPERMVGAPEAARMSLNASIALVGSSLAVLALAAPGRLAVAVVQAGGLTTAIIGFVGVTSYLFSISSLRDVAGYGSMALHTATAFMLIGAGILLRSAERGVLRPLTQDTPAGAAGRRLLPLLLITPPVLGSIRLYGQRLGFYGTEFGLSLMVTSSTTVLSALALWNAHLQGRDDRERMLAQRDEHLLLELSDLFRRSIDRVDLLWQVASRIRERLGCSRTFFLLNDETRREVTITKDAHAEGLASLAGVSSSDQLPPAFLEAARRNESFVASDLRGDPRFETAYRPVSIVSRLAVPVARNGVWAGGLVLADGQPRHWSPREVGLVRELAERTWLWLERLDAVEALQRRERLLDETVKERTAALKEREVLLQEIHHRVKNNLQIVSSLINMQARQMSDDRAKAALRECKARVEAIALVHEQLYQAADYARVPLNEYARTLANNIFVAAAASNVKLELHLNEVSLSMEQAIPCGLILNELMSNAIKHAFPEGRPGTLTVELGQAEGAVRLSVADDGVGLSAPATPTKSLGTQLIAALVRQLSGTLKTTSSPGATFEVTFPPSPPRDDHPAFR